MFFEFTLSDLFFVMVVYRSVFFLISKFWKLSGGEVFYRLILISDVYCKRKLLTVKIYAFHTSHSILLNLIKWLYCYQLCHYFQDCQLVLYPHAYSIARPELPRFDKLWKKFVICVPQKGNKQSSSQIFFRDALLGLRALILFFR